MSPDWEQHAWLSMKSNMYFTHAGSVAYLDEEKITSSRSLMNLCSVPFIINNLETDQESLSLLFNVHRWFFHKGIPPFCGPLFSLRSPYKKTVPHSHMKQYKIRSTWYNLVLPSRNKFCWAIKKMQLLPGKIDFCDHLLLSLVGAVFTWLHQMIQLAGVVVLGVRRGWSRPEWSREGRRSLHWQRGLLREQALKAK